MDKKIIIKGWVAATSIFSLLLFSLLGNANEPKFQGECSYAESFYQSVKNKVKMDFEERFDSEFLASAGLSCVSPYDSNESRYLLIVKANPSNSKAKRVAEERIQELRQESVSRYLEGLHFLERAYAEENLEEKHLKRILESDKASLQFYLKVLLLAALEKDNDDMVNTINEILRRGLDPEKVEGYSEVGDNILVGAIDKNNLALVKVVLPYSKNYINSKDNKGNTPLYYAVAEVKNDAISAHLLRNGVKFKNAAEAKPFKQQAERNHLADTSRILQSFIDWDEDRTRKKQQEIDQRSARVALAAWKRNKRMYGAFSDTRNVYLSTTDDCETSPDFCPVALSVSPTLFVGAFLMDLTQLPSATSWYINNPKPVAYRPAAWGNPNSMIAKAYNGNP